MRIVTIFGSLHAKAHRKRTHSMLLIQELLPQ
jgi:hypothetical protein